MRLMILAASLAAAVTIPAAADAQPGRHWHDHGRHDHGRYDHGRRGWHDHSRHCRDFWHHGHRVHRCG